MLDLQALAERAKVRARLAKEKPVVPTRKSAAEIKVTDEPRPDAIVLCMWEVTCTNCGSVTEHPNEHLLVRVGKCYHRTRRSLLFFSKVPREHLKSKATAPCCIHCFEGEVHAFQPCTRAKKSAS